MPSLDEGLRIVKYNLLVGCQTISFPDALKIATFINEHCVIKKVAAKKKVVKKVTKKRK